MTESLQGRVLDGRYRVQSHIADGGMASVYLALDTRLDRDVALKVLRRDLAQDEAFASRFRREARSAARLSHPNVVAVFDQGEDEGLMFLAMEYVPGQTLRDVIRAEGPLTPRAALDVITPVLQALAAAHRAGIIHRDVKPENVILREDDGAVKVADFGLARAVTTQTSTASQTGVLLGTVAYLSPEQVERGIADARSDVYAAGLVLFEILTGAKAFTGDTPIHVAYQHVHGSVPAPSSRVPSVPAELDALVALATARDPDQRPADAGELLAQVRRSRAMLTPAELDRRPEGDEGVAARAASTIAVEPTSALPQEPRRRVPPLGLPVDRTPTEPPGGALEGHVLPPVPVRRRQPGDDRGPWRWLWAVLAVAVVAGVAAWWFLSGPGSPTVVPGGLQGKTFAQAQSLLSTAHLDAKEADSFSETVPKGIVISTDPVAGAQVRRGTNVDVNVSKGPERYAVPDVVKKSAAEARDQITATKLVVGTTKEAYDDSVDAGLVVSTDPRAGTELKRGDKVNLVVSKGKQPIKVPDYTNKPADEAVKGLTGLGLKVDATEQQNDDTVPKGSVISQAPSAGTTLFKGDEVKLVVSKGPVMVKVPDVSGKQADDAERILREAGFDVRRENALGGIFGTVHHTNPAANTEAPKGSVVTMVVV